MGFLSNIFGAATGAADVVDVQEAQRRQQAGAALIDVREPDEWRAGHVAGATHIPLGTLAGRLGELPRDQEILMICRSGNRSARAQQTLQAHGFGAVRNVSGGMLAWERAGLPVQR